MTKGPSPQPYDELASTDELIKVEYPSNGLMLQGLLHRQHIDSVRPKPVVVYLHGGFALGESDVFDCDPFIREGWIVFAPSYRGENGNGGNFEWLMGEVDDAKAAIQWVARQPFADSSHIYVFGHSIGAGISAMLSLEQGVPIAKSGGCGGIYNKEFYGLEDLIPFDLDDPMEGKMRVLNEHLGDMQMNHYAYVGKADEAVYSRVSASASRYAGTQLKIEYVEGDHFSSLMPAMHAFIREIKKGN